MIVRLEFEVLAGPFDGRDYLPVDEAMPIAERALARARQSGQQALAADLLGEAHRLLGGSDLSQLEFARRHAALTAEQHFPLEALPDSLNVGDLGVLARPGMGVPVVLAAGQEIWGEGAELLADVAGTPTAIWPAQVSGASSASSAKQSRASAGRPR